MAVKKINLLLQLAGISPIVITLDAGNILAAAGAKAPGYVLERALVCFGEEKADDVRMFLAVRPHDVSRAVGGAVLADNDLDGKRSPLHEYAIDRLCDELLMVIGDEENADFRSHDTDTIETAGVLTRLQCRT